MATRKGKKGAGRSSGGEVPSVSRATPSEVENSRATGTESLAQQPDAAQRATRRAQRQQAVWAAQAKERWKRSRIARQAAETRRRNRLVSVERAESATILSSELAKAQSELVERELNALVENTKRFFEKAPRDMAEAERQRRALAYAKSEILRLEEGRFTSMEEVEIKLKARVQVPLGRELVEKAVLDFYGQAKAEGRIEKISHAHKPGTTAKVNYRERYGVVADRRSGKLLSESNLEDVLHKVMEAAKTVGGRQQGGKLYATFSYFEYGKDKPRSGYYVPINKNGDPSAGIIQDDFGYFYQSFDATNFLGGANDPAALQAKLRAVLERKLTESAGKNAAVLIGFQVKSYIERDEEGRKEFDRAVWRRLKAAQRKAQKQGKKWIDLPK